MSVEWRFRQICDDEELDAMWERAEQQKADPPKSRYFMVVGILLAVGFSLGVWALIATALWRIK